MTQTRGGRAVTMPGSLLQGRRVLESGYKDEMAGKRLGAAAVILDGQGRVLLVKHAYGRLEVGFWDPAELPRPISDFTVRRITDALSCVEQPLPIRVGPRQWLD